jgi:hypothetical protein
MRKMDHLKSKQYLRFQSRDYAAYRQVAFEVHSAVQIYSVLVSPPRFRWIHCRVLG